METIEYVKCGHSDLGGAIKLNADKSFIAVTATESKTYKTLNGAKKFMIKKGYMLKAEQPTYATEKEYRKVFIDYLNQDEKAKAQMKKVSAACNQMALVDEAKAEVLYKTLKERVMLMCLANNEDLRSLYSEMMYYLLRGEITPLQK